jgi:diaminopimelate epimerase
VTATGPDGGDRVTIAGNATFNYEATIDVADGQLGPLKIVKDRAVEEAAWMLATR